MSILFTFNGLTVISTPTYPAPKSVDFSVTDFVAAATNPFTGSQQLTDWQNSLVSISVQLPPMTRKNGGDDWSSFLMQARGSLNAFLIGDPAGAVPKGSNLGSPQVNGASQTGYQLATKGWTASKTGVLKRGDWIQLIYRLHKVLDDVDSDSSGHATLAIYPPIRETPADGQAIVTTNAKGLFRLVNNTNKYSINVASIYGVDFDCREAY